MSDESTTTTATPITRKHVEIPDTTFKVARGPALAEPKAGPGRQVSPVKSAMAAIVAKSKRDTPYSIPCKDADGNDMTEDQVKAVGNYLRTVANEAGHGIRMEFHPGEIRFQLGQKREGVGRKPKASDNGS